MADCLCFCPPDEMTGSLVDRLEATRLGCPVLRELCIPEELWPEFRAWHAGRDPVAWHHSIYALALDRGHLSTLTGPLHRLLLSDSEVLLGLRRQYREDLKERWMLSQDPLVRHQRCRVYLGRITELQVAEWLTSQGWEVIGIEALRDGPDITAVHPSEGECDVEVKLIGTEDADFESILHAIAGDPAGCSLSPYEAINYLLFRAWEAARQLQRSARRRIAVVVISDWDRFEIQLDGGWIDWRSPRFKEQDDTLLPDLRNRFPELERQSAVADALAQINSLYVLSRGNGYSYQLRGIHRYAD